MQKGKRRRRRPKKRRGESKKNMMNKIFIVVVVLGVQPRGQGAAGAQPSGLDAAAAKRRNKIDRYTPPFQPGRTAFIPFQKKYKMSVSRKCDALKISDGTPCRGHGLPLYGEAQKVVGHFCMAHTNFYDADGLTPLRVVSENASMFTTSTQRARMIAMLQSPLHRLDTKKFVAHIQALIEERGDYSSGKAEYVYELYVNAGVIRPNLYLPLRRKYVKCRISIMVALLIGYANRGGSISQSHYDDLKPYFKGMEAIENILYIYHCFTRCLHTTMSLLERDRVAQGCVDTIKELLPVMRCSDLVAYPFEFITKKMDAIDADGEWPSLQPFMGDALFFALKEFQAHQRGVLKESKMALHQDLIEAFYSPERVERLVARGQAIEDILLL
jgi:hypothetical protein